MKGKGVRSSFPFFQFVRNRKRYLDFDEWGEAFPNKIIGAATLDRLRHGAYRLVLDGKSYRTPKPLSKKQKQSLSTRSKNGKK